MILSGTGHRPNKLHLSDPYSVANHQHLVQFATYALNWFEREVCKLEEGISGMALGWDLALAQAFIDRDLKWTAALPCTGQEAMWPQPAQRRYNEILKQASDAILVTGGSYTDNPGCMQLRNVWMVEHSDHILALWDGSSGGTGNCIIAANANATPLTNVWSQWLTFRGSSS